MRVVWALLAAVGGLVLLWYVFSPIDYIVRYHIVLTATVVDDATGAPIRRAELVTVRRERDFEDPAWLAEQREKHSRAPNYGVLGGSGRGVSGATGGVVANYSPRYSYGETRWDRWLGIRHEIPALASCYGVAVTVPGVRTQWFRLPEDAWEATQDDEGVTRVRVRAGTIRIKLP